MLRVNKLAGHCKSYLRCMKYSTTAESPSPVSLLPDSTITTFRNHAFQPELPALLPRGQFSQLPAIEKWFFKGGGQHASLNTSYLSQFGSAVVPLEIIDEAGHFMQIHQPLHFFLKASSTITTSSPSKPSIYLAQSSLSDLPAPLAADVPTPSLVLKAGRADIYATSIWLGLAPTYTPLHRDPNPNLFVQLAGRKRVRLFAPLQGRAVFHAVRARVQSGTGTAAAASEHMRGVEMMEGLERELLETAVWGGHGSKGAIESDVDVRSSEDEDVADLQPWSTQGWECEVGPGDGLFIPKGWWHSLKGVGQGMTGSVNWWFR